MKKETIEEPKQELELKDFDNADILDVLNMGNVEYLGNGDIIYNPNLFFVKRGDKWFIKTEKPKQETLEEAAEKYNDDFQIKGGSKAPHIKNVHIMNHFIEGARWQQERMFELVEEYNQMIIDSNVHEDHKEKSFKEWFEQFKKK